MFCAAGRGLGPTEKEKQAFFELSLFDKEGGLAALQPVEKVGREKKKGDFLFRDLSEKARLGGEKGDEHLFVPS